MDDDLRSCLTSRGLDVREAIQGGYQSQVHRASLAGAAVVVKVVDTRTSPAEAVRRRARLAHDLSAVDPRVVAPIEFDGELTLGVGHNLITVMPLVAGHAPDLDDEDDAAWLGEQLALLHASLRRVAADLPLVTSLATGAPDGLPGAVQLIHGDPGASNFLRDGEHAHVLDLGEAGLGPPAYDVALALFSRRFDVWSRHQGDGGAVADDPAPRSLLLGYAKQAGDQPAPEVLAAGLAARREALAAWIANPDAAPPGIRTATPEWRRVLARFVDHERRAAVLN